MEKKKTIFYSLFFFLVFSLLLANKALACDPCDGHNPGEEWCKGGKRYRCVGCGADCDCNGDGVADNCCSSQQGVCDYTCTQPENMYEGRGKFTVEIGSCCHPCGCCIPQSCGGGRVSLNLAQNFNGNKELSIFSFKEKIVFGEKIGEKEKPRIFRLFNEIRKFFHEIVFPLKRLTAFSW